jgi:hypothetical protein
MNKSLSPGNIHWTKLDGKTPPDLLDFGWMAKPDSKEKDEVSLLLSILFFECLHFMALTLGDGGSK